MRYIVEVTQVTTVEVEAETKQEAEAIAFDTYLDCEADSIDARVFVEGEMTKEMLVARLRAGAVLDELFHWKAGQDCVIFKADSFVIGDTIIYIPDVSLNDLRLDQPPTEEEIAEIIGCCYTGGDFLVECGGDAELAERLFDYCDWQHPSSALDEIEDEEDGE